eukprot:symbB.v1.2.002908.t1/scaffold115.1/size320724/8
MPSGSDGQSGGGTAPTMEGGMVSNQLAMLVPSFDASCDDVTVWSGKVQLLLLTWPKDKLNELATRLILGCKGSMFLKLQLNRTSILTGAEKGIQKLVELVGGSFGQVPLERKFELAEKALFKCEQKGDESSDSYLSRCDVVWSELLARDMKLEELQAFIMLRGSRLTADDKKRVIVDSGGETSGVLEMSKVTSAVRMLGSRFFQDMTGQRRDRTQKIYDQSAFAIEETEDSHDADTFMTYDEAYDDEGLEVLATELHDEDAALIIQFEDALMETIQSDAELSIFYASYQDARKRLADRQKARGFWPVKRNFDNGGKKGFGKGKKGKQSLAQRISNSYCRICYKRGHWKDECPERNRTNSSSSTSQSSTMAPTSFVTVEDIPEELQHLPFEPSAPGNPAEQPCYFGEVVDNPKNRKTIQAVIDTDQGTLWSKVLKKELIVDITPKNLFLLDINQLWESHDQPVNMTTSMSSEPLDHVGLQTPERDREAKEKQTQSARQQRQKDVEVQDIEKMTFEELSKEKVAFGTKMIGQDFETAFQDQGWVEWFVSRYETSQKASHRKFVKFVGMKLDQEEKHLPQKEKGSYPARAASSQKKPESEKSWISVPVGEETSEEEMPMSLQMGHLEEEVVFMRQENRQLSQRLANMESAMGEIIGHLKNLQVKTEP